jgi:GNAT superfamily N-acetyltransferase
VLELRLLGAGDERLLEEFLVEHRDSSMFLRSNSRQAGLVYTGQRLGATYVGGFDAGRLIGVAAHAWNGLLLLQAPAACSELVLGAVDTSRRPVKGVIGPLAQVRTARRTLGLEHVPATLEEDERLYVLDLADLVLPEALTTGRTNARSPLTSELELLIEWRVAYEIESLGREDTPAVRAGASSWIHAQLEEGVAWVALAQSEPVSYSAFNATLPDIVQVGGVYTPPDRRGRGYAKAVVAHSLRVAREQRGAERGVLFTSNPNAMRTYEALGFRHAGEYGLVLFV